MVGFIAINILGNYQLSNFELSGNMKAFEDAIVNKILRRYDKVALGCLVSFWVLAIKFYRKVQKAVLQ